MKLSRVSVERLCAGPAVPLIYAYMREKHPNLERKLENYKSFDDISSKDIIGFGMETGDPLCMLVIKKFAYIFGTETGNFALKTLPYGGVYLIGGVTAGMHDFLRRDTTFMDAFHEKGRLSDLMRQFPIFLVDPSIEVGILGVEELARRLIMKKLRAAK
jgi:glucokinase